VQQCVVDGDRHHAMTRAPLAQRFVGQPPEPASR